MGAVGKGTMRITKEEIVLRALLRGVAVTPMWALRHARTFRLSSIIYNIRRKGYDIVSVPVRGKRYVKYQLED